MTESSVSQLLVFIFPGYSVKASKYKSLKETVENIYPKAKVEILKLALHTFSLANPNRIVEGAIREIDIAYEASGKDVKIILIGHSTGAVIARKVYAIACGENEDAPFERDIWNVPPVTRDWACLVDRLVLFAGINKGWTINAHIRLPNLIKIQIAIAIGNLLSLYDFDPVAFKFRKGASFITQLRIQSLSMKKKQRKRNAGMH